MIARRALLSVVAATLAVGSAHAQPHPAQRKRIGFIGMDPVATASAATALWERLAELGWRDGDTMTAVAFWVYSDQARAEAAAAALVAARVDVIFATNAFGVEAARGASTDIPVVFAVHGDPVGAGHVVSLARPGGNVTGVAQMQPEIASKGLQVLLEAAPSIRRVAVLFSPRFTPHRTAWTAVEQMAQQLGIEAIQVPVNNAAEIETALDLVRGGRAEALLVINSPVLNAMEARTRVTAFALEARLPSLFGQHAFAEAGGLLSFGVDVAEMHRRAAHHVDKILRGAKPAELPVEQPTRFELVVNMKTARALGLAIPLPLLARADTVIE